MQVMIDGQPRFQPFGLSYWGFADLIKERPRPLRERITEMQVMIDGQPRFQPFGLSYWGFADLIKEELEA
jgi:hypothetical protein